MHDISWDALRLFLTVAERGSITAAARALGMSQPTVSRHLAVLEESLHAELFERVGRGVRLTEAGLGLLEPARAMQAAARSVDLRAGSELRGTVRLTASEMTASHLLPPIVARVQDALPEVEVELVVSNEVENLLERSADLAVRHAEPGQGSLVARRVGGLQLGLFAHRDYLARRGPVTLDTMHTHRWIGYDSSDRLLRGFRQAGVVVERSFFQVRCDDQAVGWELARAGVGIAAGTRVAASHAPELVQVLADWPIQPMPVWVTAHRELRRVARLRAVYDLLAEGLTEVVDA